MTKTVKISGMHCKKCAARVEAAIKSIGGRAKVDLEAGTAVIEAKAEISDAAIKEAVEALGFTVG